eukprot:1159871-Pelagomonas_calceolata.AAC.11
MQQIVLYNCTCNAEHVVGPIIVPVWACSGRRKAGWTQTRSALCPRTRRLPARWAWPCTILSCIQSNSTVESAAPSQISQVELSSCPSETNKI